MARKKEQSLVSHMNFLLSGEIGVREKLQYSKHLFLGVNLMFFSNKQL